MKEYTQEEMRNIERTINNYIMDHDKYSIKELCKIEEYALHYFIQKAMMEISTLEHITNIINDKQENKTQ